MDTLGRIPSDVSGDKPIVNNVLVMVFGRELITGTLEHVKNDVLKYSKRLKIIQGNMLFLFIQSK